MAADDPVSRAGGGAGSSAGDLDAADRGGEGGSTAGPLAWRLHGSLFAATVASIFLTSFASETDMFDGEKIVPLAFIHALQFTGTLVAILLTHELAHYFAARRHGVDASLPFFIPLPLLSPFGTMGAVIRMRGTIPNRRALLDIGASGPLAGMVIAIPAYLWGVAHSRVVPAGGEGGVTLGESVLLRLLDWVAAPALPTGMDVELSPVAFAAWAGMFVTMFNLVPVGQLDGGHVAYALFGKRQDTFAKVVHRGMLAFFFVGLAGWLVRDIQAGLGLVRLGKHLQNSMFWLFAFEVLAILGALSTGGDPAQAGRPGLPTRVRIIAVVGLGMLAGVVRSHPSALTVGAWFGALALLLAMERRQGVLRDHGTFDHPAPSTSTGGLGASRTAIAVLTLLLFAALFMTTPFFDV